MIILVEVMCVDSGPYSASCDFSFYLALAAWMKRSAKPLELVVIPMKGELHTLKSAKIIASQADPMAKDD